MPKTITREALAVDAGYVIKPTLTSSFLATICKPMPSLSVLEPGCGSGKLGMVYWFAGSDVVLLDIDPEALAYAAALRDVLQDLKPRHLKSELVIASRSIFDLEKVEDRFDFVFNEGVPHHFPRSDPRRQECFRQMAGVTKRGGTVCVVGSLATPRMLEYAAKTSHAYMGMPEHQEPFTKEELRGCLEAAGLEDIGIETRLLTLSMDGIIGWGRKP